MGNIKQSDILRGMKQALVEKPKPVEKVPDPYQMPSDKLKEVHEAVQKGEISALLEKVLEGMRAGKTSGMIALRKGEDGKLTPVDLDEVEIKPGDDIPESLREYARMLKEQLKDRPEPPEDTPQWAVNDPETGRCIRIKACRENIDLVLGNVKVVVDSIVDPFWLKGAERILVAIEQFFYLQIDAVETDNKNLWANLSRELHNLHAALSYYARTGGSPLGIALTTPGLEEEGE